MNPPETNQGSTAPGQGSASTSLSIPSPAGAIEHAKRRFGKGGRDASAAGVRGRRRRRRRRHAADVVPRAPGGTAAAPHLRDHRDGVAFGVSLTFTNQLWAFVSNRRTSRCGTLGYPENLTQIEPMETFNIIWFKMPIVISIFLASPWLVYQVWAFISPGLYRKERRWAAPFILGSAGLFILGGVFAYFVVFRYGLTFLLGIGKGNYVVPMIYGDRIL